jgi:hypothetical protein
VNDSLRKGSHNNHPLLCSLKTQEYFSRLLSHKNFLGHHDIKSKFVALSDFKFEFRVQTKLQGQGFESIGNLKVRSDILKMP